MVNDCVLKQANEILNINKHNYNKLVFVYSAPKVGSTSIVSSLRLFCIEHIDIIHIHDEEMLKVLTKLEGITINEIILYNKSLGKNVYVINVYRTPIERKISTFFEKIGSHHFNANEPDVNTYNISKVIHRFNHIFPWIGNGDHFIDKYDIPIPETFDYVNKYVLIANNGIKYISLRLKDASEWGNILTNIFGTPIRTIKDYESSNKPIKDLYVSFKQMYKVPINLLTNVMEDKHLSYYYSKQELTLYYNEWLLKSTDAICAYTCDQYKLYETISIENCHIDKIQFDHYFDEGCICKACCLKRYDTISKLMKGMNVVDRIVHKDAKFELIQKRTNKVTKITNIIRTRQIKGKNFKNDMTSIVMKGYK